MIKLKITIQIYHLGHFILTCMFIKIMNPNEKFINVSSEKHKMFYLNTFENIENDFEFYD